MISFRERCYQAEMLDGSSYSIEELTKNLEEIDTVNRLLGGHKATIKGLQMLLIDHDKEYIITDFGCGSGDTLRFLSAWIRKNNYKAQLIGVDMNVETCNYAKNQCENFPDIQIINADFRKPLEIIDKTDIGISCLVCHHLNDRELKDYLLLMNAKCKTGFIINDLHRNAIAYYSIMFLSRLSGGSAMLQNDAPLSVRRAFKKKELLNILKNSNIFNFTLKWIWAFRYLVVVRKNHASL
jgi:SAM-dependent methyltransferase